MNLPEIQPDKVNLFVIKDGAFLDNRKTQQILQWLNVKEKARYERFRFEKDKRLFLLARGLLRYSLSGYLKILPEQIEFYENNFGKPFLKHDSSLDFNLSHSGGVAVLAISKGGYIGVDIEQATSQRAHNDIAANFFTPEECALIRQYPEERQHEVFFQLWTLKEAYIKARGKGLSIPLDSFSFALNSYNIAIKFHVMKSRDPDDWWFKLLRVYDDFMIGVAKHKEKKSNYSAYLL